jgi:virulence-associated protein VagC
MTKIFKSGNSPAVRLPKKYSSKIGTEVVFKEVGEHLEMHYEHDPAEERRKLEQMIAALREFGPITPVESREQPEAPERRGL